MANIKKLEPGQIVYSIERQRMGNTTVKYNECYPVRILAIHPEEGFVIASWNHNKPEKFYEGAIKKWKVKEPEVKETIYGTDSY